MQVNNKPALASPKSHVRSKMHASEEPPSTREGAIKQKQRGQPCAKTGKNETMHPPFLSAKMDLHRYRYPALLGWSGHLDGDLEGDTHEIAVELNG